MRVEIAYASSPRKQILIALEVPETCTVQEAIRLSGIAAQIPEINLSTAALGVFSKRVALTHLLREHDRVEIYRALLIDPKSARRARATKRP